jgi:hypothetical protein
LKKYSCPRCGTKSCGVACLNKHKKNGNCSGIADPFVSLHNKHIEVKEVQKDYLFVKDMLSNADKVKRTLSGVETFGMEPKRFKIMRMNARKIHNINLLHAPPIIERHRENISFFFVKTKTFYWVTEVLFWREVNNEEVGSRFLTPPLADSLTILEVMPEDFLCRDLLELGINTQKKEEFSVFLEMRERGCPTKIALEVDKSRLLWECLVNQTVYEYPTLVAVHHSFRAAYLTHRQLPN